MQQQSTLRNYLQLHFIIFIWGFTAVLGLLVNVASPAMVLYRTFLTVLGILGIRWWQNRNKPKKASTPIPKKLLLVGFLVGIHWLLFFGSARFSNASVSLAGLATSSLWTSFLEPFFSKRKLSLLEILMAILVIIGLYIIFRFQFDYALGLTLAVAAGLAASLMNIFNARLGHDYEPLEMTFWEMTGAFVIVLITMPLFIYFSDEPMNIIPSAIDWFWIAVLAFGCTIYPFTVANRLLKQMSAFTVSLSLNLEPIYGILLAFLTFGDAERMNTGFYIGGAIVMSTVLMYPVLKSKKSWGVLS